MIPQAPIAATLLLCSVVLILGVEDDNYDGKIVFLNRLQECGKCKLQIAGLFQLYQSFYKTNHKVLQPYCMSEIMDSVFLVEAMIWSIQKINNDSGILPNFTLGYEIKGTCGTATEDMLFGLDIFSQVKTASLFADLDPNSCKSGGNCESQLGPATIALIGPMSSQSSVSIANLFQLESIPLVSYAATACELTASDQYPTFFRTVFSDEVQAEVLLDLMKYFTWEYIVIVATNDYQAIEGVRALKSSLQSDRTYWRICIALEVYYDSDSEAGLDSILEKLAGGLRGMEMEVNMTILYVPTIYQARDFLVAAKARTDLDSSKITWVGIDEWASNYSMSFQDYFPSEIIHGSLAVTHKAGIVTEFGDYIIDKIENTPETLNPWTKQYICQIDNDHEFDSICKKKPSNPLRSAGISKKTILGDRLREEWKCVARNQVLVTNVIDAVYAVAHGLHLLIKGGSVDPNNPGSLFPYPLLTDYLHRINFKSLDNVTTVAFTKNGDLVDNDFVISNFYSRPGGSGKLSPLIQKVGHWGSNRSNPESRLTMNESIIIWPNQQKSVPRARCNRDCVPSEYIRYSADECCWTCLSCSLQKYSNESNSPGCWSCPRNTHPNVNRTGCTPNQIVGMANENGSVFMISAIIVCCLAELAVGLLVVMRMRHWKHPLIASRSRLNMIIIFNSALLYVFPVFYFVNLTEVVCIGQRLYVQSLTTANLLAITICQDSVYMILTNILYRIGLRKALDVIAYAVVLVPALVVHAAAVVLLPSTPFLKDLDTKTVYSDKGLSFATCANFMTSEVITWIYSLLFLFPACVFAMRARSQHIRIKREETAKLSTSFDAFIHAKPKGLTINDSKLVLYAGYVILLVCLALAPAYFGSSDPWVQACISIIFTFSVNSAVLLVMNVPKFYVVLIKSRNHKLSSEQKTSESTASTISGPIMDSPNIDLNQASINSWNSFYNDNPSEMEQDSTVHSNGKDDYEVDSEPGKY